MTKKPIVAGNWKMNKTPLETLTFINDIDKLVLSLYMYVFKSMIKYVLS